MAPSSSATTDLAAPFSLGNGSASPPPTAAELKAHLQSLLDAKEVQLSQAAALGQRVLAQQMELENRILKINSGLEALMDEDVYGGIANNSMKRGVVSGEALSHYRELAQAVAQWDEETKALSSELGGTTLSRVSCHVRSNVDSSSQVL